MHCPVVQHIPSPLSTEKCNIIIFSHIAIRKYLYFCAYNLKYNIFGGIALAINNS